MLDILWGVLGMLLALALAGGGFFFGWKSNDFYRSKTTAAVARELSEKEKLRQKEDAEAFQLMLNYNADVAYGVKKLSPEEWGE